MTGFEGKTERTLRQGSKGKREERTNCKKIGCIIIGKRNSSRYKLLIGDVQMKQVWKFSYLGTGVVEI